jgi:hypothetical protein
MVTMNVWTFVMDKMIVMERDVGPTNVVIVGWGLSDGPLSLSTPSLVLTAMKRLREHACF